jgi:hypothetical protein
MAELSTNQWKVLEALLSEPTVKEAAKVAGLTPRTVYRYLNNQQFKAELRKRQSEILAQTVAAMVGGRGTALETLHKAQTDEGASWSERIRAANYWLTHTQDAIELDVLTERLERLEQLMGSLNQGKGGE